MDLNDSWYVVKLVLSIENSHDSSHNQFEEQWRLVCASSESDAIKKAEKLGRSESEVISRPDNTCVSWNYIAVTDVIHVAKMAHGLELFSRIEQPENPTHYLRSVYAKSQQFETEKQLH